MFDISVFAASAIGSACSPRLKSKPLNWRLDPKAESMALPAAPPSSPSTRFQAPNAPSANPLPLPTLPGATAPGMELGARTSRTQDTAPMNNPPAERKQERYHPLSADGDNVDFLCMSLHVGCAAARLPGRRLCPVLRRRR
jgi:hypothetical protein